MPLSNREPWRYFEDPSDPNDEAAALLLLRGLMGASFASAPNDAVLTNILARSVRFFERVTRRFFVRRDGTLDIDGTDAPRLWLPFPVVSLDQDNTALPVEVSIGEGDPLEPQLYDVNDGAWEGEDDPRDDPFIEHSNDSTGTVVSTPPRTYNAARWPYGVRNVHVTASWGYLEPDGAVPPLVQHALARLCVLNSAPNDDLSAVEDRRRGALLSESVEGRSYQLASHAISGGLTLDREIDQILRSYKRPPAAHISRPPRRRARAFVE